MPTIERIEFTEKGSYKKQHNGVSYKLEPNSNTLYATYEKNYRYKNRLKSISPSLINKFGEKKLKVMGDRLNAFGVLSVAFGFPLWISLFLQDKGFISKEVTMEVLLLLFILSILFAWIGYEFIETVRYFEDSKCKNCGKDFAYNEFKKPEAKEVSSPHRYEISLTRYWKCKFCGHTDPRTEPVPFIHKKGSIDNLSNQTCSVCKKESALEVQKNPDIKVEGSTTTKIRHYRCKYCNSYGIEIETEVDDYD
ncbi:hypothetical protein ACSAZK_03115 [Methanosarcina sp. Mfa9]|uniref:hypothetical protein n=1 Tax=Methanosarcina sp. Mfa9 TaxID=3439063 RepID=UPI003F836107